MVAPYNDSVVQDCEFHEPDYNKLRSRESMNKSYRTELQRSSNLWSISLMN